MKALQWTGVNDLAVNDVPDPTLEDDRDVIVQVRRTVSCGSDLHLLGGYIPFMRSGDVLGHEFLGEVVETGSAVTEHRVGDRVVVSSFVACGQCWYCRQELYSLCDNGNRNPAITEHLWGSAPGGCFGYSHAMGGYEGSHAEYVRVPFADVAPSPCPTTSPTSGPCSPPTPRRPAGWAPTSVVCSPATSSPCGARAASARWRHAPRCSSGPNGSSSSTRWRSGCA
ncbi:alcohol dehydrogenase catalytic domain-containing protein [Cellulosimicrobium sp. CUA-896]|uniref:alcohol dehydrogenase catalytic domain-containing protein n=1 Tax=Cellulosimicrobium sp. CUA-896 TaxID=1517881 RepID=UPI0021011CC4|nr:alcohol dehydrogenase catalytic domain-containing protein [Cellulosimicrobium sp. CUA-896]